MKLSFTSASPVIAFLLCGVAGWIAAGSKEAPLSNDKRPSHSGKSSERAERKPRKGEIPDDLARLLAPLRAAKTPEERMLATLQLARTIPVSDLERWYARDWFGPEASLEADAFFQITSDRWLAEDATSLMGFLLKRDDSRLDETTRRWVARDPGATLEFITKLKDPGKVYRMALGAMMAFNEQCDPSLILPHLGKLGREPSASGLVSRLISLTAKSDPQRLVQESAHWSADLKDLVTREITFCELSSNPASALARLSREESGKQRFIEAALRSSDLVGKLFDHVDQWPEGTFLEMATKRASTLVASDPLKWLQMDLVALGLDEGQSRKLREAAISKLALEDPRKALEALQQISGESSGREAALSTIFQRLAQTEPAEVEALLATLGNKSDIRAARNAIRVNQEWQLSQSPPKVSAGEWIGKLAAGETQFQITDGWSKSEIATVRESFRELPPEKKRDIASLLSRAPGESYYSICGDAIAYLAANPQTGGGPADVQNNQNRYAATTLASQWGDRDPVGASLWVQSLPASEERTIAVKSLAAQWADYEPAEARRWIATLPPEDRANAESHLEQKGLGPR